MANTLVIVESPAKAKTIKKYLGRSYSVMASMGHIRDLPKSQMGVDIEHDFEPKYITIRGKGDLISRLKKEAKAAKTVFLATDPDREGEAISWHLAKLLDIPENEPCRITFNEITKTAVQNAIQNPRAIDLDLVDAQQARRILDRIVGYTISPLLWKKVKKGLSAGRVQSVATRLIVDREKEIESFRPEEYWSIDARLADGATGEEFTASFYGQDGKKIKLHNRAETEAICAAVEHATFCVDSVKNGEKMRYPAPPFITSTLQQEASRKLGFTGRRTMMAAQQLYEGVDVEGHGALGLITYMRTDSLRIAAEALDEARAFITERYGKRYLPNAPRRYKTNKNAQDAHEAIRPSYPSLTPQEVKSSLTADQYKVYKLIWERFIACQMENAVYDVMNADLSANGYQFKANGSKLKFPGFMTVYVEGVDDASGEDKENTAPYLREGDRPALRKLAHEQHFTKPPARYTEATLIRELEEKGVGRPSTYVPTITTITSRGYVVREKKQLVPTELGTIVTEIMVKNFRDIADIAFTAQMEEKLDGIEDGKTEWKTILRDFYGPFEKTLASAEKEIEQIKLKDEESDVVCEKCGRRMVYKMGRFGKFLACPGFPACHNAKPIIVETGVACPKCGGRILEKKTKKGRKYFGCEHNPTCDFMVWDEPVKGETCPKCGGPLLRKSTRGKKTLVCWNESCGYTQGESRSEQKSDRAETQ